MMPKMINLHELLYTEITKSEAIRLTSGATSEASSSEPQQEVYKQYTVKLGNRKYTAHNNKTVANYTANSYPLAKWADFCQIRIASGNLCLPSTEF